MRAQRDKRLLLEGDYLDLRENAILHLSSDKLESNNTIKHKAP